jgi:hypothetical protein
VESVNSRHDAVGYYWNRPISALAKHGFLYSGGLYSQIDVPDAVETRPLKINDQGIVFGTYVKEDGTQGTFTWSASTDLPSGYRLSDAPVHGAWPYVGMEGWNNSGQIVGTLMCLPEGGSTDPGEFGFLATPAQRVPLVLSDREPIDVSKHEPLRIGLLSTPDFSAPANADSVVLLPWEWIWGMNDLRGGAPPLRYQVKDLNRDGLKDVLFTFERGALYNPSIAIRGVVLKGFLPDGLLFYGLQPVEVLNNIWP